MDKAGYPQAQPAIKLARPRCPGCLRALRGCICALARPVEPGIGVLILQHPLEVLEAKGTARLLHLCLPGSRLLVGESFEPETLRQALFGGWSRGAPPCQPLLLYPDAGPAGATGSATPRETRPKRLVLIDGTWRKSRVMLRANPLLLGLPRLALPAGTPGGYAIRKAEAPGQLSTFEAAALALARLQGWPPVHPALRDLQAVFDGFLAQHRQLRTGAA